MPGRLEQSSLMGPGWGRKAVRSRAGWITPLHTPKTLLTTPWLYPLPPRLTLEAISKPLFAPVGHSERSEESNLSNNLYLALTLGAKQEPDFARAYKLIGTMSSFLKNARKKSGEAQRRAGAQVSCPRGGRWGQAPARPKRPAPEAKRLIPDGRSGCRPAWPKARWPIPGPGPGSLPGRRRGGGGPGPQCGH
jgi:hypothetical protein